MKIGRRSKSILIILVLSTLICYLPNRLVQIDGQTDTVFEITLLCSNTDPTRMEWANKIKLELAHIGINASIVFTSGTEVQSRTEDYLGPYPIPTFAEGGYDIACGGWRRDLNFDQLNVLYHSSSIIPNGRNDYQYSNPEMDAAIENYLTPNDNTNKQFWAEEIQDILYEDNPSIPIYYSGWTIPYDSNLVDWSPELWMSIYQSMENWTIPGQTEFHYATPRSVNKFHIYKIESYFDAQWLRQIYNGLIERRESLDYGPRIATSWETTDGMNYTVELNPNAKWADGTPINTSDVEFSYQLLINTDFVILQEYEYWSQYLRENSVTIIDADTCIISFNRTYAFQEDHLAIDLVPKHIWEPIDPADMEAQASDWAYNQPEKIFGAGPYNLAEYNITTKVLHLERNDYFDDWTGITPYFDDIYFEKNANKSEAINSITSGDIDMIDPYFNTLIDEVPISCSYSFTAGNNIYEIGINMEHPYFGTGELCPISGEHSANYIRKAISHIIPRQWIIDNILDGLGFPGITAWSPFSRYFKNLESYEYNITKAQEYMLLAGFDLGIDTDTDGISDFDEYYNYSTNPYDEDSDNDLMPDGWEIDNSLDPLINDSSLDPDMDGLTNIQEYNYGTDPLAPDSDGDGYTDKEEIDAGSDPLDPLDFPTTEIGGLNYFLIALFSVFSMILIILLRRKK